MDSLWRNASDNDELWVIFCDSFSFATVRPVSLTSKASFQAQFGNECVYIIANRQIYSYSVTSTSWRPSVLLRTTHEFGQGTSLVVASQHLVVTGLQKPVGSHCASILIPTGTATVLLSLLVARFHHGSLDYRSCVYVFGGSGESTEVAWKALWLCTEGSCSFSRQERSRSGLSVRANSQGTSISRSHRSINGADYVGVGAWADW